MANEFNEPWRLAKNNLGFTEYDGGREPCVVDASNGIPIHLHDLADDEDADVLRRVIACVNFCRGMPTELLESWHRIQHEKIGAP